MALRRFKQIILFFFIISCQSSDEVVNIIEPIRSCNLNAQIIIGDNDWIDYTQTHGELQDLNEQTVAQVKIPALMANCTGFLINENVLMTNNHCIPSAKYVKNLIAIFRDVGGERTTYLCDDFIVTSAQYDFTLVRCNGNPGEKFGYVGLSTLKPDEIDPIYLVQVNLVYSQMISL
jgi:hypothetical protein